MGGFLAEIGSLGLGWWGLLGAMFSFDRLPATPPFLSLPGLPGECLLVLELGLTLAAA